MAEGVQRGKQGGRAFGLSSIVAQAGLGLSFKQPWWPSLALTGAAASLLAIVPWVRVVPPGAWAGALLDLGMLVALLGPWAERVVNALR